jgi:hypothetical protein
MDLELVIYLIEEVNKTVNDKEMFYWKIKELLYALETEIEIVIDSITVVGIKTLLNTVSITL